MPTADAAFPFLAIAFLAGVSFGVIAFAYRVGQGYGLSTVNVFALAATGGLIFFVAKFFGTDQGRLAALPRYVWVTGLVVGFGQYFSIKSANIALKRGPLTPVWCAATLSFLPGVGYAAAVCHEPIGVLEYAGLIVGTAAVIVAAVQQSPGAESGVVSSEAPPEVFTEELPMRRRATKPVLDGGPSVAVVESGGGSPVETAAVVRRRETLGGTRGGWMGFVTYALLLVVMVVSNGMPLIGIKELGRHAPAPGTGAAVSAVHPSPIGMYQDFMWVLLYGVLVAGLWLDLVVTRRLRVAVRPAAVLGVIAAAGSIGGIWGLGVSGRRLPGAVAFTIMCCSQILTVAVGSAIFFRERRTRYWYATVALSVLAVVLVNFAAVQRFMVE